MPLATVQSRALDGLSAEDVAVEVHLAAGLPSVTIVGLPETEVKEARDRVRAALQNSGFEFPAKRITINLAPADLPKESGRFDLPIALGILAASEQIPVERLDTYEFAGELSLSGRLRPIRGALAMVLAAEKTQRSFILPEESAREAALAGRAPVLGAKTLLAVVQHLIQQESLPAFTAAEFRGEAPYSVPDLSEVRGQAQAKRALEIAAAGGHSLLLVGPPGAGKSMLAARLPGIIPPMTTEAALASAAILSLADQFNPLHFGHPPFRTPHHTASSAALVGGGRVPRPGEISLAHHGVLFLDELPEFDRRVLEALREPLETGRVQISRITQQSDFPAKFQLVAAMNPCPCGYHGDAGGRCRCTPDQVLRYRNKISGPLLDRIDLQIEVPPMTPAELQRPTDEEASSVVRARVIAARARQYQRQGEANAALGPKDIEIHCALPPDGARLLEQAMRQLGLSARAYHRVLRIARTIADLAAEDDLSIMHISEAIQYRRFTKDKV